MASVSKNLVAWPGAHPLTSMNLSLVMYPGMSCVILLFSADTICECTDIGTQVSVHMIPGVGEVSHGLTEATCIAHFHLRLSDMRAEFKLSPQNGQSKRECITAS